ncbi:MAG: acyl-CoA/acyl-ACP dehydrogenase [Candidatus Bathyarchaeota archaeon]|nr:acyl-CoA/acyl-ACP dehydrogenase [Candidatus Bathyarchaeum tardum]WGM90441.1 MAG: acyl-CoA/acyl-ACP dehydrogenase [Candidatus Bathyarchaeum tardum]
MDFELTKTQKELKESVRSFCEKEFDSDYALDFDKKEEFPFDLYRKSAKQGFSSLFIPKKYGGKGQGYQAACLATEEMCKADSSLGLASIIGTFGSDILLRHGTEEQKLKYLPNLCQGITISAAAFTEPARGTDLSTVDTKATKNGDYWTINGTKTLITNAPIANFFIVLCQTNNIKKSHQNLSLFIVDKKATGITVTKLSNKMGIRCVPTGKISFKNVNVSAANLLGKQDEGFSHSMDFFTVSRTIIAAQAVGTAQGVLDIAVKYAQNRKSAGQPIIRFQQIGAKIAQIASEIEAARLLTYKAAWTIDQNTVDPMLTSMAKLYASKVAVKATDAAVQVLGGYGYLGEYKVERAYRDAKITEIYEGTSEIQRLAVLKQLIKKL